MATTSIGAPGVTFPDASVQSTANTVTNVPVLSSFSTPGTWTKPGTVKAIKVTVVAGGGVGGANGSGAPGNPSKGGGGGGGGTSVKVYPAPSLPGPQPYTVGGSAAASSFGVLPATVISATAGSTGGAGNGPTPFFGGSGGGGGSGSGGNLNIPGGPGTYASPGSPATTQSTPGTGGVSSLGGYGVGGGGGAGTGGAGVVVIEEFY